MKMATAAATIARRTVTPMPATAPAEMPSPLALSSCRPQRRISGTGDIMHIKTPVPIRLPYARLLSMYSFASESETLTRLSFSSLSV